MNQGPPQKRRRVLVVDFDADRPFFRGAASYFRRSGRYQVDFHLNRAESLRWVEEVAFDGFICVADADVQRDLVRHRRPVVSMLSTLPDHPVPHLLPDDDAIGRLAAEHLVGQGYRRFAYFGTSDAWSMDRFESFAAKLVEHRFECARTSGPDKTPVNWAMVTNEAFVARWLAQLRPPVAVMAADDRLARILANACIAQGLRVPHQVAILGVDNIELYCEFDVPTLSSVDSGFERMGYEAAAMLERMIGGEKILPTAYRVAPTGVTARESTASLAFTDQEILAAMQFIREHACADLDVNAICKRIAVSRRHLERRFHEVLGHTPFEEIRRQRMDRAKDLLINTQLSMLQIAVRCGYETASSFVTAFRTRVGCTPDSFRRQHASR
jgi:LacI family transcriptional regulator